MRFRFLPCLLIVAISSGLFLPTGLQAQRLEHEALFLGNSYTYVNDLPGILRQLAVAGGDTLTHDQNTPGGYTFNGHSSNATSINKINARDWDFVVLQEQSQLPSFSPGQVANQVLPYAALLDSIIKTNDSCTETVFYMTWGRKHGDASNCGNYPPVCTYAGMQTRLRASYLLMAQNNNATVAPCGVAWWETILRDSTIELYNPDESHPSYAGSYLNACVFYATLYRKSPLGLNYYGSLDSLSATFLQEVAHDVVFDSLEQWRIGHADVLAGYAYTIDPSQGMVWFSDSSSNASWWQWDFGDGGQDSVENPQHQYAASGFYPLQLIVGNGCHADTLHDTIQIVIQGLTEGINTQVEVYPNPSSGVFQLKVDPLFQNRLVVRIYNLSGSKVYEMAQELQGHETSIDPGNLASGDYLMEVEVNGERLLRRLRVEK